MVVLIEITDAKDDRLREYVGLRDMSLRKLLETEQGIFIAEGEKVIRRALQAGYRPRSFLLSPRWLESLRDVLTAELCDKIPIYLVTEDLAEQVTGFHVHRGALAACYRERRHTVSDLLQAKRLMVMEDIVDHANVGAIIRNAAAFGWDGVVLSPRCADPLYRRAIKVSMGTVFSQPWARSEDWNTLIPTLQQSGFTVVALALSDDALDIADFQPPEKLAVILGTEGSGISGKWLGQVDQKLIIPMRAGVDSLNVAATAALAGYLLR